MGDALSTGGVSVQSHFRHCSILPVLSVSGRYLWKAALSFHMLFYALMQSFSLGMSLTREWLY